MSERELKEGYVRCWFAVEESGTYQMGSQRHIHVVLRESDKAWWPENLAPDGCYEPEAPPVEPPAAPPPPKFEVGQWVESASGAKGVVVGLPDAYGVTVKDTYSEHVTYGINGVKPCAPVPTEAQLAIRVGDEVRSVNCWDGEGRPDMVRGLAFAGKTFTVSVLDGEGAEGIMVGFQESALRDWLWNLEPVNPRV